MVREALTLSVVIPTLNEERALPSLLRSLSRLTIAHEVIVTDGGSEDSTRDVAHDRGARVVEADRGRGAQLADGASAARGSWLFFVHADAHVPPDSLAAIEEIVSSGASDAAYAFRLRIDGDRRAYRLIERIVTLRTRAAKLPYGDQGLLLPRAAYDAAGGYQRVPLMEDVALARALRGVCELRLLPQRIVVSDRRWRHEGVLRATLRNWWLLSRYLCGTPPSRLADHYRRAEPGSTP